MIHRPSHWAIRCSVPHSSVAQHNGGSGILFPSVNDEHGSITINDDGLHCLINISQFSALRTDTRSASSVFCSPDTSRLSQPSRPLSKVQCMIDMVHGHTCGQASYADMLTILQRSNMWSDVVHSYLSHVIEHRNNCIAESGTSFPRKVALGVLNLSFKYFVMVDYFYLDQAQTFYAVYSYSTFLPPTVFLMQLWILHLLPLSLYRFPISGQPNGFEEIRYLGVGTSSIVSSHIA